MLQSLRTLSRLGRLAWTAVIASRRVRLEYGQVSEGSHTLKSWLHGFAVLHWRGGEHHFDAKDGRRPHALRLWWRAPKLDCLRFNFSTHDPMADGTAHLDIDMPPLSVSLAYEGDWPLRTKRQAENRCLSVNLSRDGWFSWRLWLHPDNRDPRGEGWRCRSGNLFDIVLGREEAVEASRDEHVLGIPLPDGTVAPCHIVEKTKHMSRPRWPFKRAHRYCNVSGSEAAYKLGLNDQSFWLKPGWGLPQIIGQIVEQVACEVGPGRFFWKPSVKHCLICKGVGAVAKPDPTFDIVRRGCDACGGFGLRPLAEVVRAALVEACGDIPEGPVPAQPAFAAIARATVAVQHIVERALHEPLTSKDPAVADALLTAAICYMRLGRLGECAEVVGMALTRAPLGRQTDMAQRLLSQLARMPLPETPLWLNIAGPRVKVLVQPANEGSVVAVPMWDLDAFAELMSPDAEATYNLRANWHKLEEFITDLKAAAVRAGWTEGQPLSEFVERLRNERNEATNGLDEALWHLNDALRISIPEGVLGQPVREFNAKAGAFLRSQGRSLCVRPTTSQ